MTSLAKPTRAWFLLASLLCIATLLYSAQAQAPAPAQGKVPRPPVTERYSVQMFAGGTEFCWIAVWPPSVYTDGTPIPFGTPVQIKVYRSYDGGQTYGTDGVQIAGKQEASGAGNVGQGERDARQKNWIDVMLKTPVDYVEPYAVWLAASAVVEGQESAKNNEHLTFRYRAGNQPLLLRYRTPDVSGQSVADEFAQPLPQELPGLWAEGGRFMILTVDVTPGMKAKIERGEVEGCNAAALVALESKKKEPFGMEIDIKTIAVVPAPGSPSGSGNYPGTLELTITDPANPQQPKKPTKYDFNYIQRPRAGDRVAAGFIRFDKTEGRTQMKFGGHFFQSPTHYLMFGSWRMIMDQENLPGEWIDIKGTWTVSKKKPAP